MTACIASSRALVAQRKIGQEFRAQVAGEDDDGLGERCDAALPVRQAALFHDLQQHVQDARVRLFAFVEQDDGVGRRAHAVGQLAAALKAHVTGRCADEAVERIFLLVLGHVQRDQGVFAAEHEIGQRLGEFRLAHARRAEEQERADRPLGVFEAHARRLDRARHRQHRFVLTGDARFEVLDHLRVLGALVRAQLGDGHARHQADGQPHVVGIEPRIGRNVGAERQAGLLDSSARARRRDAKAASPRRGAAVVVR